MFTAGAGPRRCAAGCVIGGTSGRLESTYSSLCYDRPYRDGGARHDRPGVLHRRSGVHQSHDHDWHGPALGCARGQQLAAGDRRYGGNPGPARAAPPEVSDKVQKIAVQATKAAGHLRELVAFARRDGVSPKVELKAAVERAISLRRYYLTRGRVVVTIDAPVHESLVVQADSQHVVQVLVNLVINAEESVAKHDVRTIRVRSWRNGGAARHVEFVDSGPGFDAADSNREWGTRS